MVKIGKGMATRQLLFAVVVEGETGWDKDSFSRKTNEVS